jgi:hypothetical protein
MLWRVSRPIRTRSRPPGFILPSTYACAARRGHLLIGQQAKQPEGNEFLGKAARYAYRYACRITSEASAFGRSCVGATKNSTRWNRYGVGRYVGMGGRGALDFRLTTPEPKL